jgi:conjugal transfer pilus assembly protein TraE
VIGKEFLNSISGLNTTVRFLGAGLGVSLIANLFLSVSVLFSEPVITLRPPYQAHEIIMQHNSANGEFKKSWGLYSAMMLGNVTPGSTDIILEGLEMLMTPRTYKEMRQVVAAQAAAISKEQVTIEFDPRGVHYEPETGLVFVTGTQTRQGTSGEPQKSIRTFEMDIRVDNFRPQIRAIRVYDGNPLTKKAKEAIKNREAKKAQ